MTLIRMRNGLSTKNIDTNQMTKCLSAESNDTNQNEERLINKNIDTNCNEECLSTKSNDINQNEERLINKKQCHTKINDTNQN